MSQIPNPILNSPYAEPKRHWKIRGTEIVAEVVEERRLSSYLKPVPQSKRKRTNDARQLEFDLVENGIEKQREHNQVINNIRELVGAWRRSGYPNVTPTTRKLLEHWSITDRVTMPLFYCQIESVETAIFLTEAAHKVHQWVLNDLKIANESAVVNHPLPRMAFKMATGSGKTVVMGMLIAWQALNKLANPMDTRFGDAFLIVTPGITIRDRLRVLYPAEADNVYVKMDLVPSDLRDELHRADIVITNYHAFMQRAHTEMASNTRKLLVADEDPFIESPDQMVARVCGAFGTRKNIIVINDEAHHCYRGKPGVDSDGLPLRGDDLKDAKKRDDEARVWHTGLEHIGGKLGIRQIFDLSATPFFLSGSGYPEGTLFPWVVSDFSLIDAIEAGIVKIPRVPTNDNTGHIDPKYRVLYHEIKDELPKGTRSKTDDVLDPTRLPDLLEGALRSLYHSYEQVHDQYERDVAAGISDGRPPVFIVVCNNTRVSKWIFDYIAGWERPLEGSEDTVWVPGACSLFSNVKDGRLAPRMQTILIDSQELESDEALPPDFKKLAAIEIEQFKRDLRTRPGVDPEKLDDKVILREVMNTVGKPGTLGGSVRCVVSVSMLTEGWDCNTVTHVLGVRAFGTQLLCEQVVGRALRRRSYALNDETGLPEPEYAEVYGVPFEILPVAGSVAKPNPGRIATRVRALPERIFSEVTFPRVVGYRHYLPPVPLQADFNNDSHQTLTTEDLPTETEMEPLIGESVVHDLDLSNIREQQVAFEIAGAFVEKHLRGDQDLGSPAQRFPEVLALVRRWMQECLHYGDGTYPGLLQLRGHRDRAIERLHRAILRAMTTVAGPTAGPIIQPRFAPQERIGTTSWVDFETYRETYPTSDKCQLSHVVADSEIWEAKVAQNLEAMDEVSCYVKNDKQVGFLIPYEINGKARNYIPDFIVYLNDGRPDPLKLVIEVTGYRGEHKATKVDTVRSLWLPAINGHGGLGRWAFLECTDPWVIQQQIRDFLVTRLSEVPA